MTYSSYFLITELNKGKEVKLMDVLVVNEEPLSDIAEGGTIVEGGDRLGICTCDKKIVRVNMLFFNECYILAYQCKYWGITKGQKLGISLDTILS
ncbi:MAG: hypothetical protein M0P26_07510, partial [Bacteroidales bacterium]|nr:hypothetical protein [Bacteroidales bacterium]